jgi:hypothetical protein
MSYIILVKDKFSTRFESWDYKLYPSKSSAEKEVKKIKTKYKNWNFLGKPLIIINKFPYGLTA